jgi:hypothetical protein
MATARLGQGQAVCNPSMTRAETAALSPHTVSWSGDPVRAKMARIRGCAAELLVEPRRAIHQ